MSRDLLRGETKSDTMGVAHWIRVDSLLMKISELLYELAKRGRAEHGRYFWHSGERYVAFLSEFFLRRSNRSTVARFLPGFVEVCPSFDRLAVAPPEYVVANAGWAGLWRRVAVLPEIAAAMSAKDTWTVDELLDLPYIGQYAAEGIALYVFDQPTFPIDNNVRRVLGRYLGLDQEGAIIEAASQIKTAALRDGGTERLKDTHRGVLAFGWEPCAARPRCVRCELSTRCKAVAPGSGDLAQT